MRRPEYRTRNGASKRNHLSVPRIEPAPIHYLYLKPSDPRTFLPGMPFAAYGGMRATFWLTPDVAAGGGQY